nr:glycosyltransferase [uncultured Desulfobacter sp.]
MTKVSILIPIFNTEKFLRQCLDSIINQTLKEIEIICLNDGSTDGCPKIIEEYAKKDERIKVVHKENTGYGHTMNVGLALAEGDYIGIVESDDYVADNMFEFLYSMAINEQCDIVKADYYFSYEEGVLQANLFDGLECRDTCPAKEMPQLFCLTPTIWSAIYKKQFLTDNKILFHETPGASYQDLSFTFKVLLKAKRIRLTEKRLLFYRHDNPDSSIYDENKKFCVIDEFYEIRRFIFNDAYHEIDDLKYVDKTAYIIFNNYLTKLSGPDQYTFIQKVSQYYQEWMKILPFNDDMLAPEAKNIMNQIIYQPREAIKYYQHPTNSHVNLIKNNLFSLNAAIYAKAVMAHIFEVDEIIIYGAGKVGDFIYQLLKKNDQQNKLQGYCVTLLTSPETINGYKIQACKQCFEKYPNALYLVATNDKYQNEILKNLKSHGIKQVISMHTELRSTLKKKYLLASSIS